MKDWDLLQKPWSREDCRDRYVMGDKIGLRKLAEISEVPIANLYRWSSADNWPQNREQFKGAVMAKTQESVSEAIAEKASAITERHYEGFKEVESLGASLINLAQKAADQMAERDRIEPYHLQALTSASTNAANVYKAAIEGQRQALWLDLENINVAIGIVEKHGYHVTEADPKDAEQDQTFEGPAIEVEADNPEATP